MKRINYQKINKPLGCDYWFNEKTKCAETAIVYMTSVQKNPSAEPQSACRQHKRQLQNWIYSDLKNT